MAYEFHLPDIGEGVIECEIIEWKVSEGEANSYLCRPMWQWVSTIKAQNSSRAVLFGTITNGSTIEPASRL